MKKHIFGFVLFSFIVVSFGLIYAFFYAPSIPSKEAVKPPAAQTETRNERPYSCPTRRVKDFSYEVESANYFADQGKLISKVKLYWNGKGPTPKNISISPRIFTLDTYEKSTALSAETFYNPFERGNSVTVSIESKFIPNGVGSGPANLYVVFDALDSTSGAYLTSEKINTSEAFHILYVYGEGSETKTKNVSTIRGKKEIPE